MSYSELADAIAELKEIFTVEGSRDNVVRQTVVSTSREVSLQSSIMKFILSSTDGGYATKDIIRELEELSAKTDDENLASLISIFYNDGSNIVPGGSINEITSEQTNETPGSPSKSTPQVSLIQIKPANLTPARRYTDACTLLMNNIPSYEWSRAVPVLNVSLLVARPPVDENGKITAMSLGKFLLGNTKVRGGEKDFVESSGVPRQQDTSGSPETLTITGMELFTSPQTLVNGDEGVQGNSAGRFSPVIDKFRPLMSIQKLDLNIASMGAGAFPYKHGKLELVLHDRSRLGEISDLVRPDLYSSTELLIEYGWSHPDGGPGSNNSFGKLINASRVKEKYGVKNSSFSFDEGGQAKITLEIVTKGLTDLSTSKITETREVIAASQEVERLTEAIASVRSRVINSPPLKEIIPVQILDSTSDTSKAMTLTPDLKEAINNFLHPKNGAREGNEELVDALQGLLGPSGDGSDGAIGGLDNALKTSYDDKLRSLNNGVDPILTGGLPAEQEANYSTSRFVSLGKLLLRYMAEPLTATGRFDEVQILTYAFNPSCGAMRNANISALPIKTTQFTSKFQEFVNARGRFNLTIREFIDYVVNNFVDDITSRAYGLDVASEYSVEFRDGELVAPPSPRENVDETLLRNKIEENMRKLGIPDGEFTPPKIAFQLEAVPRVTPDEESFSDDSYSLLRIHIYDEASTPFHGYNKVLDAIKDRYLGTVGEDTGAEEDANKHRELQEEILKSAASLGLVEVVDQQNRIYKLGESATPRKIKQFVADNAPYIHYGNSSTGVKSAGVRSIHDPLLSTDHMQRMGLGDPSAAPGVDGGSVPIRMLPTELEASTMGCPFFNYTQQYFVDMDTGTTVDNIYGITGASFTIEQGKFDTSVKMINMQAFGTFRSTIAAIKNAIKYLEEESKGI